MTKEQSYNWFIIFLLSFFISEAVYKIILWEGLGHIRVSAIVKIIAQIIMLVTIMLKFNKTKKNFFLLISLFICYVIGQLSLLQNDNIFKNLEYFNNSVFIILTLLFFNTINLTAKQRNIGIKLMERVFVINGLVVIIGFFFSIKYFKTYSGERFGYDGLLMKSSYSSYLNLIALFYGFHKYFICKTLKPYVLMAIISSALLSGTKSSLLALFLVIIYIFVEKETYKNKYFTVVCSLIILTSLYLQKDILFYFENNSDTFAPIIKKHGYLTAFFSYRDLILTRELIPYIQTNWTYLNFFFGGMGNIYLKSGMGIIDLFYFFGFIGSGLYVYLFKRVFISIKMSREYLAFSLMIIIISSFAGNFFYNSSLAIFLTGIKFYLDSNNAN